jgi:hypothetical protein
VTEYFHGQRVKLVNALNPVNNGCEGFFNRYEDHPTGHDELHGVTYLRDNDCIVDWDSLGTCACPSDAIVPVRPSGSGPCEAEFTIPLTTEKANELVL